MGAMYAASWKGAKGGEEDRGQDGEPRPGRVMSGSTRVDIRPTWLLSRGLPCLGPRLPRGNSIEMGSDRLPRMRNAWKYSTSTRSRRVARSAMWASSVANCDDVGGHVWTHLHPTSTGRRLSSYADVACPQLRYSRVSTSTFKSHLAPVSTQTLT